MKNVISFYNKEQKDFYSKTLIISSFPNNDNFQIQEKKVEEIESNKDIRIKDNKPKNILSSLHSSLVDLLHNEKKIPVKQGEVTVEGKPEVLNQANQVDTTKKIQDLFNNKNIKINSELNIPKEPKEEINTTIKKSQFAKVSSDLLVFSQVDLELEKATIILDSKDNTKVAIDFGDILKKWEDRDSFVWKNHLLIIIETKSKECIKNPNSFISKIKTQFLFSSVSLLIVPDLTPDEFGIYNNFIFNNYNFIGNKLTILRDFNINLITNPVIQPEKIKYKNNLIHKNFGDDDSLYYTSKQIEYQTNFKSNKEMESKLGVSSRSQYDNKHVKLASIRYPNGEYYEGEIIEKEKKHIPNGFGTLLFMDSSTYSGYFKDGKREGKGCFITKRSTITTMIWKNDEQNGFMREYGPDGKSIVYEGIVEKGLYHGIGKKTTETNLFEGEFKKNKEVKGRLFQKYKNAWREVFKGEMGAENLKGRVLEYGKANDKLVFTHYGQCKFKDDGDICVEKGSYFLNYIKLNTSRICFGKNEILLAKDFIEGEWKIDRTDNAVCTQIRTRQYFQRLKELKKDTEESRQDKFSETDLFMKKGFVGYLQCDNGDTYIGEFTDYLPCGYGVLYRKANNQIEIGEFSKDKYEKDKKQIRQYWLDYGLIIKIEEKPSNFIVVREHDAGQKGGAFLDTLQINLLEQTIYKGCVKPVYEQLVFTNETKNDKSNLKDMIKTDIRARFLKIGTKEDENEEYLAVVVNNIIKSGRYTNKDIIYNGNFNELRQFHGYGELRFNNCHKLYYRYMGEFKDGEINGLGELKYKNGSLTSGYFKRIENHNDNKGMVVDERDWSSRKYGVMGNYEDFYPTINRSYSKGFSIDNTYICEDILVEVESKVSNSVKLVRKPLEGKFIYNEVIDKPVFQSNLKINDNLNTQINLNITDNTFEIVALTVDNDGNFAKNNMKMSQKYIYHGSLNLKLEMEGSGKLKFKDGSTYVGKFKNNEYSGMGRETKVLDEKETWQGEEKLVKMKEVNNGTFLNGRLSGSGQRTFRYLDENDSVKPLFKGRFQNEIGKFEMGHLIEGFKEIFAVKPPDPSNLPVLLVGKFHVKEDKDGKVVFEKALSFPETHLIDSIPILKGIRMIKTPVNDKKYELFGGKIVKSKHIPGKYTLCESGIRIYTINYNAAKKTSEYTLKLICEVSEFKEKVAKWENIESLKETINGKGRLYKISDTNPKKINEKTNLNELNDRQYILYEGDFVKGKFGGKGLIYYSNGEVYSGDIKNSFLDLNKNKEPNRGDFGTLIQPLVGIQTGLFKDDLLNGKTVILYQNGIKFKGEMKNGKCHGKGTLLFPDGTHFEGMFENEKIVGSGVFYNPNNTCIKCVLDHNSNITGDATYIQGKVEINCHFVENRMSGYGTIKKGSVEITGTFEEVNENNENILDELVPLRELKIRKGNIVAYGKFQDGIFKGKIENLDTFNSEPKVEDYKSLLKFFDGVEKDYLLKQREK